MSLNQIPDFMLSDDAGNVKDKIAVLSGVGGAFEKTNKSEFDEYKSETPSYPILFFEISYVANAKYPYGDVRRYGAVGDGIVDDSDAIKRTFENFSNIELENDKIYKLTKSIRPSQYIRVKGKNSLIRFDGTDHVYLFYNDNSGTMDTNWEFADTSFVANVPATSETVLFRLDMHSVDYIGFENCKLIANYALNAKIDLFFIYKTSCKRVVFNNCELYNYTKSTVGGSLFLRSSNKDLLLELNNCYVYQVSRDEIIGFYGNGGGNVLAKNCKFYKVSGINTDKVFSIFNGVDGELTSYDKFITFEDCSIDVTNDIGIVTTSLATNTNIIDCLSKLTFKNCSINSETSTLFYSVSKTPSISYQKCLMNTITEILNCTLKITGTLTTNIQSGTITIYDSGIETSCPIFINGIYPSSLVYPLKLNIKNNVLFFSNVYTNIFERLITSLSYIIDFTKNKIYNSASKDTFTYADTWLYVPDYTNTSGKAYDFTNYIKIAENTYNHVDQSA